MDGPTYGSTVTFGVENQIVQRLSDLFGCTVAEAILHFHETKPVMPRARSIAALTTIDFIRKKRAFIKLTQII
jgi:hypothetical protein